MVVYFTALRVVGILQIKNPCVDPTRVSIQEDTATTLPAISYIVTDPEEDYPHGSFSIVTSPNTHTLCEPLLLTPDFDGPIESLRRRNLVAIDNDDRPLSYEENGSMTFTV